MHVLRAVWERGLLKTEPAGYPSMTALTFVAAGMSAWAWYLLVRRTRA